MRELTDKEKFIAAAVHRLPGLTWSAILTEVGMQTATATAARDTLIALGVLLPCVSTYINSRGHTRSRMTYRISDMSHPWIQVYDAWLNAGTPLETHPLPERFAGRFSKGPASPATAQLKIPKGKIHSERARLIETFLRNLGAPWSQVRVVAGIHFGRLSALKDSLQADGILLPVIDRYRDGMRRTIIRTIFLLDEGKPEVKTVRQQYGLKRPHTPPVRRAALDPQYPGVDLTVPASLFPLLTDDGTLLPEPVPPPKIPDDRITRIDWATCPDSVIEALMAKDGIEPERVKAPMGAPSVSPMSSGLLALLDAPASLPVPDVDDIDPESQEPDQAPEQETLGFTAWSFPESDE